MVLSRAQTSAKAQHSPAIQLNPTQYQIKHLNPVDPDYFLDHSYHRISFIQIHALFPKKLTEMWENWQC